MVELDGSQHHDPARQGQETERTKYLESMGCLVLRFSNLDVMRQFRNVCEAIDMAVGERVRDVTNCIPK